MSTKSPRIFAREFRLASDQTVAALKSAALKSTGVEAILPPMPGLTVKMAG